MAKVRNSKACNDPRMNRRRFIQRMSQATAGMAALPLGMSSLTADEQPVPRKRPNILFALADDWSWPHASAYGASAVRTPHFDRVAREGCLFDSAFTAAPQCSPNRAATLTGRNIWQIEEAGTHASLFPKKWPVYTDLLEEAGYHVGFTGKGWGPGDWERGGWTRNPAGEDYSEKVLTESPPPGVSDNDYAANFEQFLQARETDQPFCFWFGGKEPHRVYEEGAGIKAGKKLEDVAVPGFLPDTPEIRSDLLDYLTEVEWFDAQLGRMLALLEARDELDNTIVVVSGDNGMPFPAAKANVYEYGVHVPLAVRWPEKITAMKQVSDLVSFIDLAPTFLEAAGVDVPDTMTGRGFLGRMTGDANPPRGTEQRVLFGRERHTHARYDNLGYPSRAIRTRRYLYIRNFKPDRWPAGDPEGYEDIDASPTKTFMIEHREEHPRLFAMGFGQHPEDELYEIKNDPACLHNLAQDSEHQEACAQLRNRLMRMLEGQGDPRALGTGDIFESYPRVSGMRPWLGGFAEQGEYNPKYQP